LHIKRIERPAAETAEHRTSLTRREFPHPSKHRLPPVRLFFKIYAGCFRSSYRYFCSAGICLAAFILPREDESNRALSERFSCAAR
jgi:hypothetical protein